MDIKKILTVSLLSLTAASAFAQGGAQLKWYGFVRNYFAYDSRETVAGTEDLFTYLPKDEKIVDGVDLNEVSSFRFAALTSRLGLDVSGYEVEGWKAGAKIEADFYAGVTGVSGTAFLRLRQAYMTMGKGSVGLKIGQAWHPLAADMPDVVSLNAGSPFNAFNRSPMVLVDYGVGGGLTLSAAAIWQMQYNSAGPAGQSANYIKYGCTPELYLGLSYKEGGFLARAGVDMLSIKPRRYDEAGGKKVSDRITTLTPYVYLQYSEDKLMLRAKSTFAQAGEHLNFNGGYGVSAINSDGSWDYTPTRNSSSWVSVRYGKKLQGVFFAGYVKNFGTAEELADPSMLYFSKNSFSNLNSLWRITPTVVYNLGKVQFALEYELTSAQYGKFGSSDKSGLATQNLHWVTNNRLQAMVKYSF